MSAGLHDWFFKSGLPPGGGHPRIDRYTSQGNEAEISLEKRGEKPGFEVKGLITTRLRNIDLVGLFGNVGAPEASGVSIVGAFA